MAALFRLVAMRGGIAEGVAIAVYAAGFFSMFGFSFAYNMTPPSPLKWLLRRFDHSSIYLMIAGTYTPLLYQLQSRTWALALAIVVWAVAIAGVVLKVALPGRFDRLSIVVYLLLGWTAVIAAKPLYDPCLTRPCSFSPLAGGVFGRDHLLLLAQPEIPERHLALLCGRGGRLSLCRYRRLRCARGCVIGEVVAAEKLGLRLYRGGHPVHDAYDENGDVQIQSGILDLAFVISRDDQDKLLSNEQIEFYEIDKLTRLVNGLQRPQQTTSSTYTIPEPRLVILEDETPRPDEAAYRLWRDKLLWMRRS